MLKIRTFIESVKKLKSPPPWGTYMVNAAIHFVALLYCNYKLMKIHSLW